MQRDEQSLEVMEKSLFTIWAVCQLFWDYFHYFLKCPLFLFFKVDIFQFIYLYLIVKIIILHKNILKWSF